MSELFNTVVPKQHPLTESEFHSLLVAGMARVAANIGRGNLADRMGRTTRALDKVFAGSTPDAKAIFDALAVCPTILDELLGRYGYRIAPLKSDTAIDFEIIADTSALIAEHTEAMRDGVRDHRETFRIADKARPVVAKYSAIIHEADTRRAA